jgi:hypothetical protein
MKEICSIWERAGIPTKPEKKIIDQLVELHKHWCKIKKIKTGARNNESNLKIINNFEEVLNELCDVSPPDVMKRLRASRNEFWEEDYQFLLGQRKFPQIGLMNGTDRKSLYRLKRLFERSDSTASGLKKKNIIPEADNEQHEDDQLDQLEVNEDCNYEKKDSEFALPKHHQPPKPSQVMVQIPTKILLMLTGVVADRTQLSIRSQLAMTATIVKVGRASLNDFTLSTTSAWRQRNEQRVTTANNIKKNWDKPPFAIVHWDSKLLKSFTGKSEERLAVLVSGGSFLRTPKLLGIPAMNDSTGLSQHNATMNLLEEWKIKDDVIALVFDTTASNTGRVNGCASLFEESLQHSILWLACRHHIYELHFKHVAGVIRGKTTGPTETLFVRFQADWDTLDQSTVGLRLFDWSEEDLDERLIEHAKNVLIWASDCLLRKTFPREDYLELVELTVIYLGGSLPVRTFKLRKPGANHHARFMSKAIYYLKMFLMSKRFDLTLNEEQEVERMAFFVGLFHSQAFLTSRLACSAPSNDFKYLSLMYHLKSIDHDAGSEAILSCSRHLWYLTQELVVLCLFDENLSPFWRYAVAQKIYNTPREREFPPGKPTFPDIRIGTGNCSSLIDLVGPKSWLLFHLLGMNHDQEWLQLPVEYWTLMKDYKNLRDFVSVLEVVNDSAERGIKIVSDFKDMCRNLDTQEYLFQVVEAHRKKITDFKKSSLQRI